MESQRCDFDALNKFCFLTLTDVAHAVEFCDYGCMSVCDVPSRQSVILSLAFVLFSGEWGAAVPVPVHRNLIHVIALTSVAT